MPLPAPHSSGHPPVGFSFPGFLCSPAVSCPLCLFFLRLRLQWGRRGGCATFSGWLGETCCLWPWVMQRRQGRGSQPLSVWPSPALPHGRRTRPSRGWPTAEGGRKGSQRGALGPFPCCILFLFPISQVKLENGGGHRASCGVGTAWKPGARHSQLGLCACGSPSSLSCQGFHSLPGSRTTAPGHCTSQLGAGAAVSSPHWTCRVGEGKSRPPSERRCPS